MADKDFYQTLGVDRGADGAAIKSAYRKLAKELHPDRNPDDAEAERRFKEINQAYDVLKDDDKRSAYDRFGHDAFESGAGGGQGGGGFDFSGGGFARTSRRKSAMESAAPCFQPRYQAATASWSSTTWSS